MAQRFEWSTNGLDKGRFEALTKLLRLRYNGQVEVPTYFDDLEAQINDTQGCDVLSDDTDLIKAPTLDDSGTGSLQRAFLDRLGELVADEKGGRHVAATLMITNHDGISVFVAKNGKIRPRDQQFLKQIETLLRLIADEQNTGIQDELWMALLAHSETRIQDYISNLRQLLKQYHTQSEDPTITSLSASAQPLLLSDLKELHAATFAKYPSSTKRNEVLVIQAHRIYKSFSAEDFDVLPFSGAQKFRTALGFLGRLRTSFSVLTRAARKLPGFGTVHIVAVGHSSPTNTTRNTARKGARVPAPMVDADRSWTLTRLFDHLGQDFTDDKVKELVGSRWNKNKLVREFDKRKSTTWEVHAEMQLLPLYTEAMANGTLAVDYIGCSKKSCFLCWHFLDMFAGVKTRGCHGKLYNLWGLPDFQGVRMSGSKMEQVVKSVRDLESLLRREILNGGNIASGILPLEKESTIGPETVNTIIPGLNSFSGLERMVSNYLQNQRAGLVFLGSSVEEPQYEVGAAISPTTEQQSGGSNDASTAPTIITADAALPGGCGNFDCEKTTTRRCSHCGGGWFCSIPCEDQAIDLHLFSCNRRPITSADILAEDCMMDRFPEDPQVREDYGFDRCRNRAEETNLFSLYVGVFRYNGASREEVHRWFTDGVLAEKIIEQFSKLSEDCRGGYYAWFLRHRYVLPGGGKNDVPPPRDMDNPEEYIQELYRKAREYLDPWDRDKDIGDLRPFAKQYCFEFLAMLLDNQYPPPVMKHLDLWFDFGYVVCSPPGDLHEENNLSNMYQRLLFGNKKPRDHFRSLGMEDMAPRDIPFCRFDEFWKAWEEGSLMELFGRYGVVSSGADNPSLLAEFLAYPGKSPDRPSVWKLRHFLAAVPNGNVLTVGAPEAAVAAALEYGFHPRLDVGTMLELHRFYVELFGRGGVSSRLVDEAKRVGRLYEVLSVVGNIDERVERVLRGISRGNGSVGAGGHGVEVVGDGDGQESGINMLGGGMWNITDSSGGSWERETVGNTKGSWCMVM